MKVLVVGGAGYLGSIIFDLFKQHPQMETFYYDNFLFENEDVNGDESLCKKFPEDVDIIFWSASQENNDYCEYFGEEELDLMRLCMSSNAHIIFCSTHRMLYQRVVRDCALEHYFKISQMLRKRENATELYIPEMYGPSKRMRWDTIVNSLIYSGFTDQQIVIGEDIMSRINIASVFSIAKKIFEIRERFIQKNFKSFQLYSQRTTLLELAYLVKDAFEENQIKVNVEVLKFSNTISDYVLESSELMVEDNSLKGTISNMKLQLEKGMFEDFQSDKYNNEIFLSSLVRGLKFLRKNKCQLTPPKQQ